MVSSVSSVDQWCPTLCNPMDCRTPGFPVHHQHLELAQTHVYWVGEAIQPSHPLSSPSPLVFNLSQNQGPSAPGWARLTSWQIKGEKMETVADFIFGGSKVTADGDYSHEIKRWLLLGRKALTNLESILKRRDITLLTKVFLVKAMVFPVVKNGYESWTIKKAEH